MDKIYRFVGAHRKGVLWVTTIVLGIAFGFINVRLDLSFPMLILLGYAIVFPIVLGINMCAMKLLNPAVKTMTDRCDPYPYLAELQNQLSYRSGKKFETGLRLDLAMALHNTGSYEVALNVMRNIPIDRKDAANPVLQAIYFNNLAAYLTHAGDFSGAEEAWLKLQTLANGKAKKAFQKQYASVLVLAEADHLYRIGEYAAALERSRSAQEKTAMDRVNAAHLRAKCAIAMEDTDTARRELNYVIAHGNKLAVVSEAWEMLKKLD